MIPAGGAVRTTGRGLAVGALVGVACGVASAAFLHLLDAATATRVGAPWLVFLLPVAGFGIGSVVERWGGAARGGTGLVLDTHHAGGPPLPRRMAPLVLFGTVLTHLFGGSAGREGTAVQMGSALADRLALRLRLEEGERRLLLLAGAAGGFGSVFGTPFAGAIFGLEFPVVGRLRWRALAAAAAASFVGDLVTRGLGVVHTAYPAAPVTALDLALLGKWTLLAAALAAAAAAFIEGTAFLAARAKTLAPRLPHRMALGGVAVLGLLLAAGTDDYLGLGIPVILGAFDAPAPAAAFAWKIAFTAATLAAGFPGGEVTPLFFVGATLGSAMAAALGVPLPLAAGVGLAAVFAAAANTPLALSVMALELLGPGAFPHAPLVCFGAYFLVGHRGIYPSQILVARKWGRRLERPTAIRDLGR